MDDIVKAITDQLSTDPKSAIEKIKLKSKDVSKIDNYIKEYRDFGRNQRDGQVDRIQLDKSLADNKVSKMVKIYLNHAQNIVETLATFVVGKPVSVIASEDNNLSKLVKQIWRVNRIDAKLLQSTVIKMSQTQVAMNFYIKDLDQSSMLNRILIKLGLSAQKKEIKAKVLNNEKGVMTPYFDGEDNMLLFMWSYVSVNADDKNINNVEIWDIKNKYYLNDESGELRLSDQNGVMAHGFDRIPIVYDSQKEPQWYTVASPIDRHEVALSKLGDANDYSGHPILVTEGIVTNMPLKEESGKHFNIPIKFDKAGNEVKGNVRFLEAETAPESNKLELDKLEEAIAYGSGVPNLSLEKLKSLGNVAEKTVKLMFLATELKSEFHRNSTKVFIERCINIIISGITNATNTGLRNESQSLYYDIHFNSILPSDISEKINYVSKGIDSNLISRRTGINMLDLVEDIDEEIINIDQEIAARQAQNQSTLEED